MAGCVNFEWAMVGEGICDAAGRVEARYITWNVQVFPLVSVKVKYKCAYNNSGVFWIYETTITGTFIISLLYF